MFLIPISLLGQTNEGYPELKKYSNFGFTFGGALFANPKIVPITGQYTLKPIPIPSYSFGISINIPIKFPWSIETGIFMLHEPSIFAKLNLPNEELVGLGSSDFEYEAKQYIMYTVSLPLLLKYHIKTTDKSFFNFQMGLKVMYLISNFAEEEVIVFDTDTSGYTLLSIYTESPEENFIGSFFYGIGYSYALKNCLITTSLNHIVNFQNTNNGYYGITNLVNSSDSYGKYNLSGNYFSLNLNFQFLSKKYRKEQKLQRKKTEIQI